MQKIRIDHLPDNVIERHDVRGRIEVKHVLDASRVRSESVVLNVVNKSPGGTHLLHRHPHCDQVFVALEGEFSVLSEEGATVLEPGEVMFIPRGEWHGSRNDSSEATLSLSIYCGVGSPEAAGYEEHPTTLQAESCTAA